MVHGIAHHAIRTMPIINIAATIYQIVYSSYAATTYKCPACHNHNSTPQTLRSLLKLNCLEPFFRKQIYRLFSTRSTGSIVNTVCAWTQMKTFPVFDGTVREISGKLLAYMEPMERFMEYCITRLVWSRAIEIVIDFRFRATSLIDSDRIRWFLFSDSICSYCLLFLLVARTRT